MKRIFFLIVIFFQLCSLLAVELKFGKISFEGNEFFSDEILQNAITIESGEQFSMDQVANSASKIARFYQNGGYYNVMILQPEIITSQPPEVDVVFPIIEQGRLQVDELIFSGNRYLQSKDFPDFTVKYLNEIPSYLDELIEFYNNSGFLFAIAQIADIEKTENGVQVEIQLTENEYCEFDKIRIRGNEISQANSIIRLADLDTGKLLQPNDLTNAAARLRARPYLKDAAVIPLNNHELLIDITEDKMTLFSGIVGYDDSADDKITGYFNLDFLNLFGTDRSLSFFWQKLSSQSETLELRYHESGVYQYPIEGDLQLYRQQQDSTYIRSSAEIEVYYKHAMAKYGLYFAIEKIVPAGRDDEQQITGREYTKAGVSWRWDSFDYPSNPTKGFQTKMILYNIRQAEEEVLNRQALESTMSAAISMNDRFVFYSRLQANLLENRALASMDYWKLGGFNNLRGFMENSFYGYYTGSANLELRYLLAQRSRLFLFSDYGYAQNDDYTKGKLFGVGLGMRLETNLGVFGVDYGIGYSEGEWRSPMNGIIHFGLEAKL